MTVDLTTRYLGLTLRSPIVASAAPHNNQPDTAGRLERAGVGAIVLPSLFEEEILAEELGLNRSLEQGTEAFAEALDYFPAVDALPERRRSLPAGARTGQGRGRRPDHRQPQRRRRPAAGSATPAGCRTPGADALELNLYHVAADPRPDRRRRGGRRPRPDRGRPRRRDDPARRQAQPVLLGVRELRGGRGAGRRRRPRPVQPVLPAGPRPRHARRRARARAEPRLGAPAAGPLDRAPPAPARRRRRRSRRRPASTPGPTWSRR